MEETTIKNPIESPVETTQTQPPAGNWKTLLDDENGGASSNRYAFVLFWSVLAVGFLWVTYVNKSLPSCTIELTLIASGGKVFQKYLELKNPTK